MEFHYDTYHVTLCMFFGNRYIFLWSALVDICCRELFNLNLVHLQEFSDYRNWSLDRIETFVEEFKMVFKCIAISSFIVRKTIPRICYLIIHTEHKISFYFPENFHVKYYFRIDNHYIYVSFIDVKYSINSNYRHHFSIKTYPSVITEIAIMTGDSQIT